MFISNSSIILLFQQILLHGSVSVCSPHPTVPTVNIKQTVHLEVELSVTFFQQNYFTPQEKVLTSGMIKTSVTSCGTVGTGTKIARVVVWCVASWRMPSVFIYSQVLSYGFNRYSRYCACRNYCTKQERNKFQKVCSERQKFTQQKLTVCENVIYITHICLTVLILPYMF